MTLRIPLFASICMVAGSGRLAAQNLPILYVTQVPPSGTAGTVTSIGGNHLPSAAAAPRGGDLMIRYANGTIRNLTREAGYGVETEVQGPGAIAVRDPQVHWGGQKAVFSMVISQEDAATEHWQLFEITGLESWQPAVISRVPGQPESFNNVQPCYAPDDRIIFVSDRTRDGALTTYPAIDEKGQGRINTGLWSLDPRTGDVFQMEHSPSGSFDPFVDSYGRILFTRWDHLQQDGLAGPGSSAGAFDYASEGSMAIGERNAVADTFPEALAPAGTENAHLFDLFMPWSVNPDGTDLVTLNHVGRHEISPSFARARNDANLSNLTVSTPPIPSPFAPVRTGSLMQMSEHPSIRGRLYGVDAVLNSVSAGRLVTVLGASAGVNPASMSVRVVSSLGFGRDVSVLTDGRLIASLASGPNIASASYSSPGSIATTPPVVDPNMPVTNPFLIRMSVSPAIATMTSFSGSFIPTTSRTVTNPGNTAAPTYSGVLWQLQPVEVRPAVRPAARQTMLEAPETSVFTTAGVSPNALRSWMRQNNLALMTCRNVTTRDFADRQQPVNLSVPGGVSTSAPDGGPAYQVNALQFFQGDYVRGYGLTAPDDNVPESGRRVKATAMSGISRSLPGGPAGSTAVAADGSSATLVPARRALSWQLLQPDGQPVVRERYWLSFQAGEIRSCTSCHGVNTKDQSSNPVATNAPAALLSLLQSVKAEVPAVAESNAFRIWSEATMGVSLDAGADDDGDGHGNLVEWVQGSGPLSRASVPSVPLTVELVPGDAGRRVRISFMRSLPRSEMAVISVEASPDLKSWHEVGSAGRAVFSQQGYSIATTPQPDEVTELITIDSLTPVAAGTDRYFRLRIRTD